MKFTPRPYQQEIIDHIYNNESAFILAALGAGKTASTLEAINQVQPNRILLIAPLRVAKETWPNEIAKWDNFKKCKPSMAIGSPKKRSAAITGNGRFVIINQENVAWLVKTHFNDLASFDMIVVDESSAYKSPKSQRFKALKKLKDTGMIQRWVLLTATPTPNSLLEAWSQMYLLDKGDRLGRTFYAYQSRYFESDYMGYSWEPRAFSEDFIRAQISALAVVVENYSGLPDRFDITEPVYLKPRDYDTYKQLETDALIELDDGDITAVNAAVLAGKLQQLASGAVYNEAKEVVHYHDAKLDVLEDLLTQAEGENVIVAYQYKHEYDRLKHRFPHAVSIKEPNAVTDWNKGNIKLLLAQPQSCSHGLNLQDGGRRIIWFTPTWSNEQKLQMDARLYRQGQNDHVFVHTLVTKDTVDELIMEAVNTKKTLQEALILAVKQAKGIAAVA